MDWIQELWDWYITWRQRIWRGDIPPWRAAIPDGFRQMFFPTQAEDWLARQRTLIQEGFEDAVEAELAYQVTQRMNWCANPRTAQTFLELQDRGVLRWLPRESTWAVRIPRYHRLRGERAYLLAYEETEHRLTRMRHQRENRLPYEVLGDFAYQIVETIISTIALDGLMRAVLPQVIGPASAVPPRPTADPPVFSPSGLVAEDFEALRALPDQTVLAESNPWLERPYFGGVTEQTLFGVRVNEGGIWIRRYFTTLPEAQAYANRLAAMGEARLRTEVSTLPYAWPRIPNTFPARVATRLRQMFGLPPGINVGARIEALYVYEIPPGTPMLRGVAGPQIERLPAFEGEVLPGGHEQIQLPYLTNARMRAVAPVQAVPVPLHP